MASPCACGGLALIISGTLSAPRCARGAGAQLAGLRDTLCAQPRACLPPLRRPLPQA